MAQTPIETYMSDLVQYERRWLKQIDDYTAAYTTAFNSFTTTLNLQKASNARKIDLMFSALSIVGGAALLRAFGASVISGAASNVILEKIIEKEMETGLKFYNLVANSPTASFALGAVVDGAGKELNTEIKAKFKSKFSAGLTTQPNADPLVQMSQMKSYCRGVVIKMHDIAAEVRDSSKLKAAQKDAIAAKLQTAQLASRKTDKSIDDGNLSKRIELSLHIDYVVKGDSLFHATYSGLPGLKMGMISEPPTSAPIPIPQSEYKMPPANEHITPLGPQHVLIEVPQYTDIAGKKVHTWSEYHDMRVGYRQSGSIVTKRANKLCTDLHVSKLYSGTTGRDEHLRAETISKQLRVGQQRAAML